MGDDYFDPFFKGCASPSMFFGVPMLPFILMTTLFGLLFLYTFRAFGLAPAISLFVAYFIGVLWARKISKNDDQRLLQLLLRMRMRVPQRASLRYWGAVTFSPTRNRK